MSPLVSTPAVVLAASKDVDIAKVLLLIRNATGANFSHYKSSTIHRRIVRRMLSNNVPSIGKYVSLLRRDGVELDALYQDILIHVTSFFRDPETFRLLERRIFPKLIESHAERDGLRVWVAGCSTGGEAYSIAILFAECLGDRLDKVPIQIFGTDLSESSIEHARTGVYQGATLAGMSPERLERFFVRQNDGYRVIQSIRDMCSFARQDLAQDPVFSHVDLISCRKVLISLDSTLQRKILLAFHHALNSQGILQLGNSQPLNAFPDLFRPAARNGKLFCKNAGAIATKSPASTGFTRPRQPGRRSKAAITPSNLQREADRLFWARSGQAGVIVDETLQILHFRGDVSPYLSPASGTASLHLLKMVRSELLLDLRSTFEKSKTENKPARRECVQVGLGDCARGISLEVVPVSSPDTPEQQFLILFGETQAVLDKQVSRSKYAPAAHKKLQREVTATGEYLRAIIEEQEIIKEELKAANEELKAANLAVLSNNEELQSTNEELETANEELQPSNEELGTLSEQQSARNIELTKLGDDLKNVFVGLRIPILLLDPYRRVRRFNREAEKVFNLLSTDVGRPIQDLRHNLDLHDLQPMISRALETLAPQRQEVRDLDGCYYTMSVRPYRTSNDTIDGVVIKLLNVDGMKRTLLEAERARDYASAIVDTVREPLVVLDSAFRLVRANRSFCEMFCVSQEEVGKRSIFDVAEGGWDNPELHELLEKVRLGKSRFEDVRVTRVFAKIGRRTLLLNAHRLECEGETPGMILLAMEDLTDRESTTEALRQSHERLKDLTAGLLNAHEEERRRISRELHDDFNQRLAMLAMGLENLEKTPLLQSSELARPLVVALRARTDGISHDLRRIAHQLHPSVVEHLGLAPALRSLCEDFTNQHHLRIDFQQRGVQDPAAPPDIALCIYRVAQAALRNVAEHSGSDQATVTLTGGHKRVRLSVSDRGVGFDLKLTEAGKGLGIVSMQERARLVVGKITVHSKVGVGTRVAIEVPLHEVAVAAEAS